jgi:hypothetical protein
MALEKYFFSIDAARMPVVKCRTPPSVLLFMTSTRRSIFHRNGQLHSDFSPPSATFSLPPHYAALQRFLYAIIGYTDCSRPLPILRRRYYLLAAHATTPGPDRAPADRRAQARRDAPSPTPGYPVPRAAPSRQEPAPRPELPGPTLKPRQPRPAPARSTPTRQDPNEQPPAPRNKAVATVCFFLRYWSSMEPFFLPLIPPLHECHHADHHFLPWCFSLSLSSLYKLDAEPSLSPCPSSLSHSLLVLSLAAASAHYRHRPWSLAGARAHRLPSPPELRPHSTSSEPRPTSRTPARTRSSTTARRRASPETCLNPVVPCPPSPFAVVRSSKVEDNPKY